MPTVLRKGILAALLMLVAAAFAYEQFVVFRRPIRLQWELMELVNDTSHRYSEEAIDELVDATGETIYESKQKKIVKYTWQGLTWKSYDLFVVFRKFRGTTLITDASLEEVTPAKPFLDPHALGESATAAAIKEQGIEVIQPARRSVEAVDVKEGG